MAFQLEWSIEGDKQLSRRLLGLDGSLKDYTTPFRESADFLKGLFSRDVFETEGRAIGESWKRLSPATVSRKARTYGQTRPLIATGNMRASFQTIVQSDQAVIYNTAAYFKYHQSKEPRSKIPRRIMMKLTSNSKEQIVKYFQEHIRASLARP
jgi:phage gpG-like protein